MLPSVPIRPLAVAVATFISLLSTTASAATVSFTIPPSPQIPNPAALPPSTHAALTALGVEHSAPITIDNTFVFRNVTPGSYLADVYCPTHGFAPLRVDVVSDKGGDGGAEVNVWETFRGNDWDNKGEQIRPTAVGGPFPVKVLGSKVYYMERSGCELSLHSPSPYCNGFLFEVESQRYIGKALTGNQPML
jgi:ER membrane protein complex subunit 7